MHTYPWIKLHSKTLDDPRLGALKDSPWRRYQELQLLAGDCNAGGLLVYNGCPLSLAEIAWRLRVSMRRLRRDLDILESRGLAAWDGETCWLPDFQKEQNRPEPAQRERWRLQKQRQRVAAGHCAALLFDEEGHTIGLEPPPDEAAGEPNFRRTDVQRTDVQRTDVQRTDACPAPPAAELSADTRADIQDVHISDIDKEEEIEGEIDAEVKERENSAPRYEAAIWRTSASPGAPPEQPVSSAPGHSARYAQDAAPSTADPPALRPAHRGSPEENPLEIYRAVVGLALDPRRRGEVLAAVKDGEGWRSALEHWMVHRWSPHNITGQLDLYRRGGAQGCRVCKPPPTARWSRASPYAAAPGQRPIDALIAELRLSEQCQ